jgi:hypothetical protein
MQNLGNWQTDDGYAESVGSVDATSTRASHPQQLRSPLGQLIERSSSSPIRTSVIEHATSGSFVGNVSRTVLSVENEADLDFVDDDSPADYPVFQACFEVRRLWIMFPWDRRTDRLVLFSFTSLYY